MGAILFGSWSYANRAGLVRTTTSPDARSAIYRRIYTAQALYAFGTLLCVINTYVSIAFIVLVQLNYVVTLRVRRPAPK